MCQQPIRIAECLDGKALSGAINMGRTRVRASSVIVKTSWTFVPSWRRWQGNGYISRYRRRAAPRHQNVTKIGSFSVSQPPAAAKQQPSSSQRWGICVTLGPASPPPPSTFDIGLDRHWTEGRHISLQLQTFLLNCHFLHFSQRLQVSPKIITHQRITIWFVMHGYIYRNNCWLCMYLFPKKIHRRFGKVLCWSRYLLPIFSQSVREGSSEAPWLAAWLHYDITEAVSGSIMLNTLNNWR